MVKKREDIETNETNDAIDEEYEEKYARYFGPEPDKDAIKLLGSKKLKKLQKEYLDFLKKNLPKKYKAIQDRPFKFKWVDKAFLEKHHFISKDAGLNEFFADDEDQDGVANLIDRYPFDEERLEKANEMYDLADAEEMDETAILPLGEGFPATFQELLKDVKRDFKILRDNTKYIKDVVASAIMKRVKVKGKIKGIQPGGKETEVKVKDLMIDIDIDDIYSFAFRVFSVQERVKKLSMLDENIRTQLGTVIHEYIENPKYDKDHPTREPQLIAEPKVYYNIGDIMVYAEEQDDLDKAFDAVGKLEVVNMWQGDEFFLTAGDKEEPVASIERKISGTEKFQPASRDLIYDSETKLRGAKLIMRYSSKDDDNPLRNFIKIKKGKGEDAPARCIISIWFIKEKKAEKEEEDEEE